MLEETAYRMMLQALLIAMVIFVAALVFFATRAR